MNSSCCFQCKWNRSINSNVFGDAILINAGHDCYGYSLGHFYSGVFSWELHAFTHFMSRRKGRGGVGDLDFLAVVSLLLSCWLWRWGLAEAMQQELARIFTTPVPGLGWGAPLHLARSQTAPAHWGGESQCPLVDTGASVSSKAQAACTHLPNIRSLFCWDSPCDAL